MRDRKRTFKHLTKNDRLRIERWLRRGLKPREIADRLRVHISTVYRELGRGQYERLNGATWEMETAYSPDIAEAKYQAHLREKGPELKIGKDHELARYIEETILEKDCSPAAVLGYALIQGRKFRTSVSVATIYSYIKKGVFLHITQEELPRHGKTRPGPAPGKALRTGRRKWWSGRCSDTGRWTRCTAGRAPPQRPFWC